VTRMDDRLKDCETHADALTRELATATEVARRNKQHYGLAVVRMEELEADLATANAALTSVADLLDEARTARDEARAELSEARQRVRDRDKWLSDLEDAMPEGVDVESLPQSLRLWVQGVAETEQELRVERDEARDVVDTCHEYSLGLARELGDVRAELARFTAAPLPATDPAVTNWTAVATERDAALEDAKQAWFYLARSRAEVAEEIAVAIEQWGADFEDDDDWEEAINASKDCARLARQHATAPTEAES